MTAVKRVQLTREAEEALTRAVASTGMTPDTAVSVALVAFAKTLPEGAGQVHPVTSALMARGMTRPELADKIGRSDRYVANVIAGRVPVSAHFRKAVSEALGVPAADLFGAMYGGHLVALARTLGVKPREVAAKSGQTFSSVAAWLNGDEIPPRASAAVLIRVLAAEADAQGVALEPELRALLPAVRTRMCAVPDLKERIGAAGWTQVTLAKQIGTPSPYLNKIVNHRRWPSPAMARRIADAMGEPVNSLFTEEEY